MNKRPSIMSNNLDGNNKKSRPTPALAAASPTLTAPTSATLAAPPLALAAPPLALAAPPLAPPAAPPLATSAPAAPAPTLTAPPPAPAAPATATSASAAATSASAAATSAAPTATAMELDETQPPPYFSLLTFSRATGNLTVLSRPSDNGYLLYYATTMSDDFRHDTIVHGEHWKAFNEDTSFGKDKGSQDVEHKFIGVIINTYGKLINLDTVEGLKALSHYDESPLAPSLDAKLMSKYNDSKEGFPYRYFFPKIKDTSAKLFAYVYDVSPLRGPLLPMINNKLDSATSSWKKVAKVFGFDIQQFDDKQDHDLLFEQDATATKFSGDRLFPFTALYNYDMLLFIKMYIDIYYNPDNHDNPIDELYENFTETFEHLLPERFNFSKAKKMNVYCMNYLWQHTLLRCFQDVYQDNFLYNNNLQNDFIESIIILRQIYFCDIKQKDMEFLWQIGIPELNTGIHETVHAHKLFDYFSNKFFIIKQLYTIDITATSNGDIISELEKELDIVSKSVPPEKDDTTRKMIQTSNDKYIFFVSQSAVVSSMRSLISGIKSKVTGVFDRAFKSRSEVPNENALKWSNGVKELIKRYIAKYYTKEDEKKYDKKSSVKKNVFTITKYTGDTSHIVVCGILRNISVDASKKYKYSTLINKLYEVLRNKKNENTVQPLANTDVLLSGMTVRLYLSERPLAARVLTNWPETKDGKMQYVIDKVNCLSQLYVKDKNITNTSNTSSNSSTHECFLIEYPDPIFNLKMLMSEISAMLNPQKKQTTDEWPKFIKEVFEENGIKSHLIDIDKLEDEKAEKIYNDIKKDNNYAELLMNQKKKEMKKDLENAAEVINTKPKVFKDEINKLSKKLRGSEKLTWQNYLVPATNEGRPPRDREKLFPFQIPGHNIFKGLLDFYNKFPNLQEFASCLSAAFNIISSNDVVEILQTKFPDLKINFTVDKSLSIQGVDLTRKINDISTIEITLHLLYNIGRAFDKTVNIYERLKGIVFKKKNEKNKEKKEALLMSLSKFFKSALDIYLGFEKVNNNNVQGGGMHSMSPREQQRKKSYKKRVDAAAARRRRKETTSQIRKSNRDDQLNQRRKLPPLSTPLSNYGMSLNFFDKKTDEISMEKNIQELVYACENCNFEDKENTLVKKLKKIHSNVYNIQDILYQKMLKEKLRINISNKTRERLGRFNIGLAYNRLSKPLRPWRLNQRNMTRKIPRYVYHGGGIDHHIIDHDFNEWYNEIKVKENIIKSSFFLSLPYYSIDFTTTTDDDKNINDIVDNVLFILYSIDDDIIKDSDINSDYLIYLLKGDNTKPYTSLDEETKTILQCALKSLLAIMYSNKILLQEYTTSTAVAAPAAAPTAAPAAATATDDDAPTASAPTAAPATVDDAAPADDDDDTETETIIDIRSEIYSSENNIHVLFNKIKPDTKQNTTMDSTPASTPVSSPRFTTVPNIDPDIDPDNDPITGRLFEEEKEEEEEEGGNNSTGGSITKSSNNKKINKNFTRKQKRKIRHTKKKNKLFKKKERYTRRRKKNKNRKTR